MDSRITDEETRKTIMETQLYSKGPMWKRHADSIPLFASPEHIWILVAGPNTTRHLWCISTPHGSHPIVMKPIAFADDTPVKSVYDFKRK